ncbi:MAG: thrombospondin type 3 repeat-containing protein [Gammaproteobacteria bacterium]|nr:thrombospondin type 3 repeat-containing protein [Gammaproteobacteria bacterium]
MQKILTSTAHGLVKSITTSFLRVTSVRLTTLASLLLATLLLAACGGGGGGGGGGGAPNPSGVTTNPAGNIRGVFPDDSDTVSYTLNITRQSTAPTLSLNVTTAITGDCSIAQEVGPTALTYGADNQTTTRFDITFTGTETVGGRCVANFAVNELTDLGIQTRKFSRTVTFSAEQAPALVAELVGNGENIPASMPVIVNVTATKQDAGKSIDITFPASVVSDGSPSCTATLASITGQYNTAGGISTAVAIYNVRPTNLGAVINCGTFTFTATEGPATGSAEFSRSISFVDGDTDGDGVADSIDNCDMIANPDQSNIDGDGDGDVCDDDIDGDNTPNTMDVDDDGDGLIELRTAAELNMMRHNLEGTNLTMTGGGSGNSIGCGGGLYSNNTRITTCNGYEQMADIDLEDLGRNPSGSNWEPVGFCDDSFINSCSANAFAGDFNGNGYIIGNLTINITTGNSGHGFFGSVKDATLRNVHIHGGNLNITSASGAFISYVGGLIGYGIRCNIISSSVVLDAIQALPPATSIGGLVGIFVAGEIRSSVAIIRETEADGVVGGLASALDQGGIIGSSYAVISTITTGSSGNIGGLVTSISRGSVESSYALNRYSPDVSRGGIVATSTPIVSIVSNSYWDNTILTPPITAVLAANRFGAGKTTTELQGPVTTNADGSFPDGIYSEWDNGYCNPATGEFRDSSAASIAGFVRAWNLGGTTDYPTLNCFPRFTPEQQQAAIRRVIVDDVSPISD